MNTQEANRLADTLTREVSQEALKYSEHIAQLFPFLQPDVAIIVRKAAETAFTVGALYVAQKIKEARSDA